MEQWIKRENGGGADAEWRREYRAAGITGIVREYGSARADQRFAAVVEDVRGRRLLDRVGDFEAARRLVDEYADARVNMRRRATAAREDERRSIAAYNNERGRARRRLTR